MPLYPNNRRDLFGFTPMRGVGLPHIAQSVPRVWLRSNYFVNESAAKTSSFPTGTTPYGVIFLPIVAGGMGAPPAECSISVASAVGQMGVSGSASVTINLTVSNAALQLLVLANGTATLTLTVPGASLGAAVGISGSTTAALTPNTPILGALAGLFGSATVSVTDSGTLIANGALAGSILPFTELSPENLARAVWEALATEYNTAGTMGGKLNSASAAGDPWTADPTAYAAGSAGEALVKAAKALKLGEFIALK